MEIPKEGPLALTQGVKFMRGNEGRKRDITSVPGRTI